jgi:hypothetical protein
MAVLKCDISLLKVIPCLVQENLRVVTALDVRDWALANGLDVSNPAVVASLMTNSQCLTSLSPRELYDTTIAIENNRFDTTRKTYTRMRADVKQLANTSQKRLNAMLVYLKCVYFNAH